MKIKKEELTKRYYSIGEVSKIFSVKTSLLRFWEKEFSKIHPRKNRGGDRQYTANDILAINEVYTLVKEEGLTLSGARKVLKSKSPFEKGSKIELKNSLSKVRAKLQALKERLSKNGNL